MPAKGKNSSVIRDPLIVMENVAVGDRKEVIDTPTGFGGERKSGVGVEQTWQGCCTELYASFSLFR